MFFRLDPFLVVYFNSNLIHHKWIWLNKRAILGQPSSKDAELNTYVICVKRILSQKKFTIDLMKYIQFPSFLKGNLVSKYLYLGKKPRVSAFQNYINWASIFDQLFCLIVRPVSIWDTLYFFSCFRFSIFSWPLSMMTWWLRGLWRHTYLITICER